MRNSDTQRHMMSTSPESANFREIQQRFAGIIRDPAAPVPPDMPEERMAVYRELFFNGFDSHLSGNFPVLRSLFDKPAWEAMVHDFMIRHRCRTPLFTEIGLEFVSYLQNERQAEGDPAFLAELAHYEYVELAVALSDADHELSGNDPNGDLLSGCPLVAPTTWNLSYRFPVHLSLIHI